MKKKSHQNINDNQRSYITAFKLKKLKTFFLSIDFQIMTKKAKHM